MTESHRFNQFTMTLHFTWIKIVWVQCEYDFHYQRCPNRQLHRFRWRMLATKIKSSTSLYCIVYTGRAISTISIWSSEGTHNYPRAPSSDSQSRLISFLKISLHLNLTSLKVENIILLKIIVIMSLKSYNFVNHQWTKVWTRSSTLMVSYWIIFWIIE